MNITQAIIPAAGLGTRFLPFTKTIPKELLPIMQTPALQFIIEEGLQSGIKNFNVIANHHKHAINEYFSKDRELEQHLSSVHKLSYLDVINTIINDAHFNYIPQPEPLGLGHAILMAEHTITDAYCSILLPDELMMGEEPAIGQLIAIAKHYNCSVVAVQEVPTEQVSSYGIIDIQQQLSDKLFEIGHLIEKPSINEAPSHLALIGRYVLSTNIFTSLKKVKPGAAQEIQLTDGIVDMIQTGSRVLAYKINTVRHDIGNPTGWLQANIFYGLSQESSSTIVKNYIKQLLSIK